MGNSKRNIKKLNDNFREDILDYAIAHNLKCANALAILYATGCRPDELQTGVTVNYDSKKNEIEFKIIGSKLNRRMRRGIGIRKIKVKINNENARFFKSIVDKFIENPMSYDHKIKIESAKAFSGYITKISKKLWPRKTYHASAYSFRHAKATELKNSDYDKIEIAQIMGHASVRSQQSYGRKSKKSKGGFNDIADVETNVKPRGGDRLLRFKIANKNKAAAKIADTSTPSSPPPAPVRRFKM
ncbi:TPA: site-specific integrase [Klebsiella pneumoniae]|nr:site-specific integrase [Escherichia coli]EEG4587836.1 site-specific integrase [Salmonella enterica]HBW3564979.1 site-specific integrase [Klebsiella pneumoniae]EKS9144782.1 site-specific integrase [Escherichia coli]MCR4274313.1 site-specific integrase [Escherichia coli]MDR5922632.1 site-specific integrase [Escherichia coli]